MPALLYIAAAVAALTVPVFVLMHLHLAWYCHARQAREWERRADYHAEQLQNFYVIDTGSVPEEFRRFVELLRDMDKKNIARCTHCAKRERGRIPARLRSFYMRRANILV